jgi:hypothetical protein
MARLTVITLVALLVGCGRTEVLGLPAGGAAGVPGPAPQPSGLVVVSELRNFPFDDTRPFVLAAFSAAPFSFTGDRAEFEALGCAFHTATSDDGGVFLPAGTATITTGTWSKSFDAQADHRYAYREEAATTVAPPVVTSFAGATVPAFMATLPAVDDLAVSITGLTCKTSSCDPIARDRPLVLTWKPGRGDVVLRVATVATELFCRFPGAPGTATVSVSDLQKLPAGSAVIEAGSFLSGQTTAGAHKVALRLYRQSISEGFAGLR